MRSASFQVRNFAKSIRQDLRLDVDRKSLISIPVYIADVLAGCREQVSYVEAGKACSSISQSNEHRSTVYRDLGEGKECSLNPITKFRR